jgi:hypothetical protein
MWLKQSGRIGLVLSEFLQTIDIAPSYAVVLLFWPHTCREILMHRIVVLTFVSLIASAVFGDTTIVNENFDTYANSAALYQKWAPSVNPTSGVLWSEDMLTNPLANPDGGNGVDHLGGNVMVWQTPFSIAPDATHNIVLQADLYERGLGNKRMSVGLRGDGANIVEMGFYNTDSCDPTVCGPGQAGGTSAPQNAISSDPGYYVGTDYAYRLQLWPAVSPPLLVNPDWQYPKLPAELDRPTDSDMLTNIGDIGAAWTRYTATIRQNTITIDIDLFRDGVRNISKTPGDGTPGVDGTVTWNMTPDSIGFSNLRIGSPSGVSSTTGVVFDNVLLKLVDVVAPPANSADFNGNHVVDAADYVLWRNFSGTIGTGTSSTGDANGDHNVDATDYGIWKATFGSSVGSGSAATVPEPSISALAVAAIAAMALRRRNARARSHH